jgi:2-dehydropantoate 2-reductase
MSENPVKVAVFGAGSIGCYVGGQLLSAGIDVRFIGRERFQTAIRENGLRLTHYARDPISLAADIAFDLDASGISDADIILVTVKSQDSESTGQTLNKMLGRVAGKDTIIVSFQNGVGNADVLRAQIPDAVSQNNGTQNNQNVSSQSNRNQDDQNLKGDDQDKHDLDSQARGIHVLGGMVPFNVTGTGPGSFHCGTEGDLVIEAASDHPAVMRKLQVLKTAFECAGQGCVLSDDIKAVQWGKLLVNLNNGLNTLAGVPLKTCLGERDYRYALAAMIEEALGIIRHTGIEPANFGKGSITKTIRVLRLPNWLYGMIMKRIVKIDANARSSMLDDLEAGRMSEIDYLQGEVVRLAAANGMDAPINRRVIELVQTAFEEGASPKMSGKAIREAVAG